MKKLFLLHFLLAIPFQVFAAQDDSPDFFTRYTHYASNYSLNKDGSHTETRSSTIKILNEAAISNFKQTSITYSTSIQKAEVLDAYTLKADGRRIDSPKSNFQVVVNSGNDKNAPVFSDQTTLTVVFPEVTVGDSVVFSYKITQIEPIFPGHFSTMETFTRSYPYDEVIVSIDAPVSLWTQYEAREMKETENSEKDGRQFIKWTYQNAHPLKSKRKDFSVYEVEKEPGLIFSTFKTHNEIAQAYAIRARPKAVVTERIKKLAEEITVGKKSTHDQAAALYNWVATNISYAGNCIGVGSVVPHDTPFILDNRMGDCKDHATLLQALLAAKDIQSTQALVNAGSSYRLPRIPVVSMVNHVINFIPSLNQYADSTSDSTPFGYLPFSDADKPVLLVDGGKENTRTPTLPLGTNQQQMRSIFKVSPDGSISGDITVNLKGIFAANARASLRNMPKDQDEDIVKNVFKNQGYIGNGKFEKEDPKALLDTYQYKVKFKMQDYLQRPGAGAFNIQPLFSSEAPIYNFLGAAVETEEEVDVACYSGSSFEEYTYQFPNNIKILSIPDDMKLTMDFLSYVATYRLAGNTLTVKRELEDKTRGNVCTPATSSTAKKFAMKVLQNFKSQVVYK